MTTTEQTIAQSNTTAALLAALQSIAEWDMPMNVYAAYDAFLAVRLMARSAVAMAAMTAMTVEDDAPLCDAPGCKRFALSDDLFCDKHRAEENALPVTDPNEQYADMDGQVPV